MRAFDFFGGVPAQLVPDNLKAGVTKACFYDPAINRTYGDMANHYDTAIIPARHTNPKTRPRLKALFCWPSAGYWHACATSASLDWMK